MTSDKAQPIGGMDIHVRDEGLKSDLAIVLLRGTVLRWDDCTDGMSEHEAFIALTDATSRQPTCRPTSR